MATLLNSFPRSMGCPVQNYIAFNASQRDAYIKRRLKNTDLFISVYSFSELTEQGKLDRGSAVVDKSFSDFDSNQWFKDLIKVHDWCESQDILHRSHLSGNGSHSFIWIKQNLVNPKVALGNFQRWLQEELDLIMDPKIIGDTSRIFRYPNTWNSKAGRWCIPIPGSEMDGLTKARLLELANTQQYGNAWCGHKLLDISRFDSDVMQYRDSEYLDVDLHDIDENIAVEYEKFPPCIQTFLSTPDLVDANKYLLGLYLKDQLVNLFPYSTKEIVGILKKSLSVGEFNHYFSNGKGDHKRHHPGHNGIKFKAMMRSDYTMPSCRVMRNKGVCPKDCGRRHPIYE